MDYSSQNLGQLWSGEIYREGYGKGVHFSQGNLPFLLEEIAADSQTVLEIGSSFGQCYRFLLSEGINLGDRFTGTDVSEEGIKLCRELYPQSTWVQGNFLNVELDRKFDYVIERNAIHHMPSPITCIQKAVGLGQKSVMMYMRVRTRYPTLSDINQGYFNSPSDDGSTKGRYFYNLVNIYEMIDAILELSGIREIRIGLAPHDIAPTLQNAVVPDDVLDSDEQLYYCKCLVIKDESTRCRITVNPVHLKPFIIEGVKNPRSIYRYIKVRNNILKKI